ncbi:MAG TPA: aminomethyl-transferring glycine dehydrogenase [Catalimonadaceae bacterium]|nr:aminomethyl-transferring glycine dehydrogenase [Catalimonadaceae bacterium]
MSRSAAFYKESFASRHIGPDAQQTEYMLKVLGEPSLDSLIAKVVPPAIHRKGDLQIPDAVTEAEFLEKFAALGAKNKLYRTFIGMGYYGTITPTPILRNVLENPGWYTAYTPYQAEIAQGRMEALINFQTLVMDLTQMEIANASLLDEATAAAEAMHMLFALRKPEKQAAKTIFVSDKCHPQTIDLVQLRAEPIGVKVEVGNLFQKDLTDPDLFAVLVQYPDTEGNIDHLGPLTAAAHENQVFVCVATDLLALTLLEAPGTWGADVVVGSAQRFGVPMGFGGPHAAFFATREDYKRFMPGRIIGISVDTTGKPAYRMALQTREQHIKREKATSNICTAQVLLSVMASFYGVYHGPDGLKKIANRVFSLTDGMKKGLEEMGVTVMNSSYFDTLTLKVDNAKAIQKIAQQYEINFRMYAHDNQKLGISFDETCKPHCIKTILSIFAQYKEREISANWDGLFGNPTLPSFAKRTTDFMTHPVFNQHHSEHEITRYIKQLENKDLSLVHSMIALGSCTMKLNATTEMIPVTWPSWNSLHPFVPEDQALGYKEMMAELSQWLQEVTGFAAISLQPNSGAQGEYAGLMTIRAYHKDHGGSHRNVALIPTSAHGTNPASAVMAGMKVVLVACDSHGNVDLADLKEKAIQNSENLACLMVTYPSTHGVFEEAIQEICATIHAHGGLVYMDGANMNAQVGLTSPGTIGADVCHLNLHKTFCIPHGGGGPGMGPIGVVERLAPYLPGHAVVKTGGEKAIQAISAAPYGSASILAISYAYIAMMGGKGLKEATSYAILNANYIRAKLEAHYPILYTASSGFCAHEMIVDMRSFKMSAGIEVEDIAKRLMDYGFHAPTVSFPVAGTLMIEPTESEPLEELDRFIDAMISIREEIAEIEKGIADRKVNVLKMAPHTAEVVLAENWDRPYSRQKAVYPLPYVKANKFWPTVSRIDSAYGDRNLMCACLPMENYANAAVEA